MAESNVLGPEQVSAFLTHIGIGPSHYLRNARYSGDAARDLHFLTQLQVRIMSSIPFENLSTHYNPKHLIDIDPLVVYQKIVGNARGRGGYCFEFNLLFFHVLQGLGFPNSYLCPSRMWRAAKDGKEEWYSGWSHVSILVTLSDVKRYYVDLDYGGEAPTAPMELVQNQPVAALGDAQMRFWRDHIPGQRDRREESKQWIVQHRKHSRDEWATSSAFSDKTEAHENDLYRLNWYTSAHPMYDFTFSIVGVLYLARPVKNTDGTDSQDREVYGKNTFVNGVFRQNLGQGSKIVQECKTEAERVAAFKRWIGITFTDEEQAGIKGWCTSLDIEASEEKPLEQWQVRRAYKGWSREWLGPVNA